METKHTPGPWEAIHIATGNSEIVNSESQHIAFVRSHADANLMASALDMKDALKSVIRILATSKSYDEVGMRLAENQKIIECILDRSDGNYNFGSGGGGGHSVAEGVA